MTDDSLAADMERLETKAHEGGVFDNLAWGRIKDHIDRLRSLAAVRAVKDEDKTVYVVLCFAEGDNHNEVRHIFSSQELANEFAKKDDRVHVIYDYVLDCPERHEGSTQ